MKPAAPDHQRAIPNTFLKTLTKAASIFALSVGVLMGTTSAKTLPASALQNMHSKTDYKIQSRNQINKNRNTIAQALRKHKTGLLEQAGALSWPPQFAIGQTWTINTTGVGNWTLPLSTTISGDATGYTTGTDKREGWFRYVPKNGSNDDFVINYLQGDNETYLCGFFPSNNPNGNTLNGVAFKVKKGSDQPEDLKTTCSATLGGNSSNPTISPFGNNATTNPNNNNNTTQGQAPVWPPKPGEAWSMTIDGLAPWAVNFEKLDKDGDPTGTATQNGAPFVAFAYKDGEKYKFEIDDKNTSYLCVFTSLQIQGNAFVGGKAFSGPASATSLSSLNKSCSAAFGTNSTVAPNPNPNPVSNQAPVWPPKPGEAWTLTIDGLAPWAINFDQLDKQGDPAGTASQNGAQFIAFAYKDSDGYEFELSDNTNVFFCTFATLQIQGNAFVGGKAYGGLKTEQSVPNLKKSCSAAIGSGNAPTPNPIGNQAPAWPPKVGENWSVTIDGLAPWAINFEKLDKDGDPTGTATQSGAQFSAFAFKDTTIAGIFQLANRQTGESHYCAFKTLEIKGNAFVGGIALFQPKGGQATNLGKSCTASNTSIGSAPTPNPGLTWPPNIANGQNWLLDIQGSGSWTISLNKAASSPTVFNGSVQGSDARNNGLVGYDAKNDFLLGAVYGTNDTLFCLIVKSGLSGSSLKGESYRTVGNADPVKTGTACSLSIPGAAGTTTPGGNSPFGNILNPPTPTPTPTPTPSGLTWPVQIAVGQTWSVNVKSLTFQLKLERVNNGFTIGTASSSNGEMAGGFTTQGDNLALILTDGTATITCTFNRSSIQGQTLNGQATFSEKPNAPEQNFGPCSATLTAKASVIGDPMNYFPTNPFMLERSDMMDMKRILNY